MLLCKRAVLCHQVFRHNNCDDLERRLHRALIDGHPRTRRPFKKAFIVVEGIYSMEGTICNLPRLIEIKKKYKVRVSTLRRASYNLNKL